MYSLLPAFVSALFLGFGLYLISTRGINRISLGFFYLCLTTAAWQGTWAFLFQVQSEEMATLLAKVGYAFIIFLPTAFYNFFAEVDNEIKEKRYVALSLLASLVFAVFLLGSNQFISGTYNYFWGHYPKAGPLHPLHVLQSCLVAIRCVFITYKKMSTSDGDNRKKFKLCLIGLSLYAGAVLDYLCNYGFGFYPFGVVFLLSSFACFAAAIVRHHLLNSYALAANIAHEMRTPLSIVGMAAEQLAEAIPALQNAYVLALKNNLIADSLSPTLLSRLPTLLASVSKEITRSNSIIDVLLASSRKIDASTFDHYSINACISEALAVYPFKGKERELVSFDAANDFTFYGSSELFAYALFNLLKNSLWAIKQAGEGAITISTHVTQQHKVLQFTDTGPGIPPQSLPYIFEEFYSTKQSCGGTGIGLAFCHRIFQAFNGNIRCESDSQFTTFFLEFPVSVYPSQFIATQREQGQVWAISNSLGSGFKKFFDRSFARVGFFGSPQVNGL